MSYMRNKSKILLRKAWMPKWNKFDSKNLIVQKQISN